MKSRNLRLCLIAALSCASAAAMAENPFAGTWKIDYSKSHVTGQTISFTSEADGKVRFTFPDGKKEDITAKAGQVMHYDAFEHDPENLGDQPFEVIGVELKS